MREDGYKSLQVNQSEEYIHHINDYYFYKNDSERSIRIQSAG